jgi:predicted dienelactone hydrolase
MTVVSNAFIGLGKAQARALGQADLPLAVIPHPFGSRSRDEVRALAEQCVAEIARLAAEK